MVLAERTPGMLCFDNVVPGTVVVRSTYLPDQKDTIIYKQGRDYVLNYTLGTIARSPISRIPDYAANILYGKKAFDHTKYPGYGNHAFFVWVDYETKNGHPVAVKTDQSALLQKSLAKLNAGGPFKIIVFGDSISTGCEASAEALRYPNLYAQSLQTRFPKAQITLENGAKGGDTSVQGIARLEDKVLSRNPDLVLLAFGMNDHNKGSVPLDTFEKNLESMVQKIRERTGAEVIILSTFPPNPDWAFGSHQMEKYAQTTQNAAKKLKCAYADVYSVWAKVLERKDWPSLLGNNINHPNNFGHWLYLQALEAVGF
ncbi:MAG: SGNH/GDSL hydrolase family protein [Armatimonadota bacterium]